MSKNTTNPSKTKRAKSVGFRPRMKTAGGRAIIKRRRAKGRTKLTTK